MDTEPERLFLQVEIDGGRIVYDIFQCFTKDVHKKGAYRVTSRSIHDDWVAPHGSHASLTDLCAKLPNLAEWIIVNAAADFRKRTNRG